MVVQVVRNPPVSAGEVKDVVQEDPLEEGTTTHSSILTQRIFMDRGTWQATVQGHKESDTTEVT